MPSGVLGVGGTIALIVGSVMMTGSVPGVAVGLGFIIPAALAFAVIFCSSAGWRSRLSGGRPVTGREGAHRRRRRSSDAITTDAPGYVRVHGEIWRAISRAPVAPGQAVRVLGIDGLTLNVEP